MCVCGGGGGGDEVVVFHVMFRVLGMWGLQLSAGLLLSNPQGGCIGVNSRRASCWSQGAESGQT